MHDLSARAIDVLKSAVEAFFVQNVSSANAIIDDARELVDSLAELLPRLQGSGGKGTMSRTAVMDSLTRTVMYATDIAEIAINDAMRFELKKKG